MATKKIPKATITKVSKAAETLQSFSSATVVGNDIILNSIYLVTDSPNNVIVNLEFSNTGIAALSEVMLNNTDLPNGKIKGSVINFPVGSNSSVKGSFLKIFSALAVTNKTPVPDDLKVNFTLSGGQSDAEFILPEFKLQKTGDNVNLNLSIFFLHV
jgi:hypothetical protein